MSVCFGLWNPPTAKLANCISAHQFASWWKTQRISCHSSSCALVPVGVFNLATCMCIKSEEEGLGEKTPLQYFEFRLQYLVQPLWYVVSKWNLNLHKVGQQQEAWSALKLPGIWLCWPWTSENTVDQHQQMTWHPKPSLTVETLHWTSSNMDSVPLLSSSRLWDPDFQRKC